MSEFLKKTNTVSIAILGSGGAGAITAGALLLEAAGRAGWYGLMTRSVGPQIRGGEALAMVRLSASAINSLGDHFDILLALDWHNANRFLDEIPLTGNSLIIADENGGDPPAAMMDGGARVVTLPLSRLARDLPGGRPNIIALGVLGQLLGIPSFHLRKAFTGILDRKGFNTDHAGTLIAAGTACAVDLPPLSGPTPQALSAPGERWIITGNEAAALGALRGGVRFAAVYPITPATDLSEWLASKLQALGGQLVQAEDEIAAIAMVLGASYGGVPSLTATSGPGLALMTEALGLAVAAEVPAVVINVMRGGPSTGIPTKSEQADLNIALYGLHGEAPHLVLAPHSVADCLFTTQWAVQLAEALQCPALVLSDQLLGQTRIVCERPNERLSKGSRRLIAAALDGRYDRYAVTSTGISPMALPGLPGGQYTAEGLEHNAHGTPSSQATQHRAQLDKRRDKLIGFDYGEAWAEVTGAGDLVILTWGSSTAAAREAAERARATSLSVKVISLRLLLPALPDRLARAMAGAHRVLVVEQSHSGQFYRYLRSHYDFPVEVHVFNRPGPLAIRPNEVYDQLINWS